MKTINLPNSKRHEKRVKFQLSGIIAPDLRRAQHRALSDDLSLSSVLRTIIVLYGVTGDPTGNVELSSDQRDLLNSRLAANKRSITPAHHRKRIIDEELIDHVDNNGEKAIDDDRKKETDDLESQIDIAKDEMFKSAIEQKTNEPGIIEDHDTENEVEPDIEIAKMKDHKRRYFKQRPLSDYRNN